MLDAEELAAAIVATPAHLNAEAALPCLERGVDTLLEKPPGMSLDQTRALKEAAEASGARGMVGWNRRFDPLVLQVREEIEARGPIYQLVGEFHKSMSRFIAGGRFPEIVMDNMLLESPIHAIDLVRHLGGAPVAEVHSFVRRASAYKDVHAALVVFENDCVAQICANYTTDARLERYEIHGRDISAYIEGISTCELVCDGEHKHLQEEGTDSTLAQAAHFFDCIKADRPIGPPAADLDEALATMELATAILRACETTLNRSPGYLRYGCSQSHSLNGETTGDVVEELVAADADVGPHGWQSDDPGLVGRGWPVDYARSRPRPQPAVPDAAQLQLIGPIRPEDHVPGQRPIGKIDDAPLSQQFVA